MRTRKIASGVSVAAALALTLGACGGSATPKASPSSTTTAAPAPRDTSKTVLASIRTTAAERTARESLTVTTDGSGPGAFSLTSEGAIDFASGDSQFTMDLGGPTASMLGGGLEVRSVNGVVYMKLPASLGGLFGGGGGEWISVDTAKLSGSSPLAGVGQGNPTQILAALQQVSDDVKEVGTETVRGTETTHYVATLDFAKAIDNAEVPASLRGKAKGLFKGTAPVPVDVYLDNEGRLRRMTMDVDLGSFMGGAVGASGASGADLSLPKVTIALDLYDFGAPVHVQAPPADQIVELPSLGGLGGLGGLGDRGQPGTSVPTKTS
jgi:hypothetical protein